MEIGIGVRNMGEQSTPDTISRIVTAAEQAGFDAAWVTDHIAIPPDDAEGSGGRYLDPLTTLAFVAGQTKTIKLGVGVLILPYRSALPTAKQIATVQELSGGRLLLGCGVGWMQAEFNALGISRRDRGRLTDETLDFFHRCFADDVVEVNRQAFLFRPRPPRPPFLIGGSAPHAIDRALAFGDGWMPMGPLDRFEPVLADYRHRAEALGKPTPTIVAFTSLDPSDVARARDTLDQYQAAGVSQLVISQRYSDCDECLANIDGLQRLLQA
jgi:probable F420-dependent oxidoreductase